MNFKNFLKIRFYCGGNKELTTELFIRFVKTGNTGDNQLDYILKNK